MGTVGRNAVVIGGSIGGLVTAQVLSSRFERVTVLDRDALPAQSRDRRGVPHGVHAHGLLIAGRLALEGLFPGLTDELVAGGAVPFDPGNDLLFVQMGAPRVRFRSDMLGISMSRAFIEYTIRRRVRRLSNVEFREAVAAHGVTGSAERVTGVEVGAVGGREAGGGEAGAGEAGAGEAEVLPADLVVDATGRAGGQADRWLAKLGCPAPTVARVKIDVGYATQVFRRGAGQLPDGALLALMASTPPDGRSAGAAFPIEGDRWVVTIGGWHRDHPPADLAGFREFAAQLPAPYIAEMIDRAEPIGATQTRKFPSSRRRYVERLRRPPAGYVALGDTICSFNPLYGQGMTVATLEALELGGCLDRLGVASADLVRAYYRAAAKVVETPWRMAAGGDFMYRETAGPKPAGTDAFNWYARRAFLAAHVSVPVHRVLIDVQHMLAPPSALLRPATVARSLWAARRGAPGAGVAAGTEPPRPAADHGGSPSAWPLHSGAMTRQRPGSETVADPGNRGCFTGVVAAGVGAPWGHSLVEKPDQCRDREGGYSMTTISDDPSGNELKAVLVGGPADLPTDLRHLRVDGSEQEIKVPHRGGYEHFVREDTAPDSAPVAYHWTSRTRIAE